MVPKGVADIMSRNVKSVQRGTPLLDAVKEMHLHNIGALVITEQGRPVGIFSERDLLKRVVATGLDPRGATVDQAMTGKLISVPPEESFASLCEKMHVGNFRHLPVIDGEKLLGMVSVRDVLSVVAREGLGIVPPQRASRAGKKKAKPAKAAKKSRK
ncbi:MAG: CBS domain-containing protein [Planctomycetes bacterium]|nr:CBS domain-containing protein [Planctomycetota bacterium]